MIKSVEAWTLVTVLVLNNVYTNKGKYGGTRIQQVVNGELVGEVCHFTLKPKQQPIVCCVYDIEVIINDGEIQTARFGSAKFSSNEVDSKSFLRSISLLERTESTAAKAISQSIKAAKSEDNILECLRPLRTAYFKTNSVGQMAMEVRLLNYLRNGRDL